MRRIWPVSSSTLPDASNLELRRGADHADNAIQASGEGEAVQWSEGFEGLVPPATEVHGHSYINLSEVYGTLKLDPDTDDTYGDDLIIQLDFEADATPGYVWPKIYTEGERETKTWCARATNRCRAAGSAARSK